MKVRLLTENMLHFLDGKRVFILLSVLIILFSASFVRPRFIYINSF